MLLTASDVVCEEPTLASGVAVVQPHTTTVSSFIFYECQQSGFVSSNSSSICVEDGMWSPDPSLVMCLEEPTTILIPTKGIQLEVKNFHK